MKKLTIILGILIIILVVVVLYINGSKVRLEEEMIVDENPTSEEIVDESDLKSLVVKHQYKDGKHIFIGDLEVPTPCHNVMVNILDTSNPNTKKIDVKTETQDEMCAEVITNKTFKIEYDGPQDLKFEAYVDNSKRRLNLFDLAPDVDIDEFEMFIKG